MLSIRPLWQSQNGYAEGIKELTIGWGIRLGRDAFYLVEIAIPNLARHMFHLIGFPRTTRCSLAA